MGKCGGELGPPPCIKAATGQGHSTNIKGSVNMEPTFLTAGIVLINGLFLIVGFFLVRTLKKIDANQSELFDQLNALKKDFYVLQGAHDTYIKMGKHLMGEG